MIKKLFCIVSALCLILLLAATAEESDKNIDILNETDWEITYSAGELADQDLQESYLRHVFSLADENAISAASAGDQLEGTNKLLYDELVIAVNAMADGETDKAVLEVPLDSNIEKKKWYPEELGMDSFIASYDEYGKPTGWKGAEITKGFLSAYHIDSSLVILSAMRDQPYAFYWTAINTPRSTGIAGIQYGYDENNNIYLINPTFVCKFFVDSVYQGTDGDYSLNTMLTSAAQAAVRNAQKIVATCVSMSDQAKLLSLGQAICDRTEYNWEAVGLTYNPETGEYEETGVEYNNGSAWQLLWVFDDDPNTNVVCEGYAKAFKYLVDHSTFSDSSLKCICATGDCGGAHMWNIVSTQSGNYLCDLTNADDNSTLSYGSNLFMQLPSSHDSKGRFCYPVDGQDDYIYQFSSAENLSLYSLVSIIPGEWETYDFTLEQGQALRFDASQLGMQSDAALSSDKNVITLNEGVITAIGAGSATLTFAELSSASLVRLNITVTSSLSTFTLPSDLTTLEAEALTGTAAQQLTLPSTVTTIAADALADMNDLCQVIVQTENTEVLSTLPKDALWICETAEAETYAVQNNVLYMTKVSQ